MPALDQAAELQGRQARLAGDDHIRAHALGQRLQPILEAWKLFPGQDDGRDSRIADGLPHRLAISWELKPYQYDVPRDALQGLSQHVGTANAIVAGIPGDHENARVELLCGRLFPQGHARRQSDPSIDRLVPVEIDEQAIVRLAL